MAKTVVLALGGNALTRHDQRGTLEEQYSNALTMATSVRSLIRKGWKIVIVHGNGPQVGNLAIQHESSVDLVPALPLFTLGAMTQGQLGSLICLALNEVCKQEIGGAVSVVTHIEVDPDDPALSCPTKPIGPFFDLSEAEVMSARRGWVMEEDSKRGYRRVVPSPRPMAPIEAQAISALVDWGYIVVAGGGGGIPVTRDADGAYRGVDAVIDKDFAAERIADAVQAQALVMVTGVDAVRLHFGTPIEQVVTELTASEAQHYLDEGHFPVGSMGPKIEAAVQFVGSPGRIAAITSPELTYATLDDPVGVIEGPRGTRIVGDHMSAGTEV